MKTMCADERLVSESEVSFAVLGKGRDFVLVALHTDTAEDATQMAEARSRGFFYCGVLGMRDGQPSAECSASDAAFTMMHAALAFAQEMAGQLRPKDDSVQWLTRLWELPDPRD